jgi:AcrR family transcriptional regulator
MLRPYDPNDRSQSCLVFCHGGRVNNTVLHNYHRVSYNSGSINKDLSCVGNATQEKELAQKLAQKEDLRVQRTRKLLQQALIELTVEMGFAAVTVRDITRRAMVNRSTFYRHYLDKYDLLNQYMAEVQALTTKAASLAEKTGQSVSEKVPPGLLVLVKHVEANADFYRVMLGRNGDLAFIERFRQMSKDRYRYLFSQYNPVADVKAPPIDMKLAYISYAGVGVILWWLENDKPCSSEQLAIWLGQLSMTSAGLIELQRTPAHRS